MSEPLTPHPPIHHVPRFRFASIWRNPMARSADRYRPIVRVALLVIWLLTLPIAATVGSLLVANGEAAASTARANGTYVTATLLEAAPASLDARGEPMPAIVTAKAQWTSAAGGSVIGAIPIRAGTAAGTTVPVWLDHAGTPAQKPPSSTEVAILAVLAMAAAWLTLGLVFAGADWLLGFVVRVRNDHRWDEEWAVVGTSWSEH